MISEALREALEAGADRLSAAPRLVFVDGPEAARVARRRGARGILASNATAEQREAAARAVEAGLRVESADFGPERDEEVPTLTKRERDVLTRLVEGLSNKEIAQVLGISEHTAKFHVNAILDKLGAQTRTEAVVLAVRAGLVHL